MKKILFVAAFILVCLFASSAVAEHTHRWTTQHDWEYHWQFCTECGEIKEKEEHYVMCDATAPYRCAVCDLAYEDGKATMYMKHYITEDSILISPEAHAVECKVCNTRLLTEEHVALCTNPDVCMECGFSVEEGAIISAVLHLPVQESDETSHWYHCMLCDEILNKETHYVSCVSDTPDVCSGCGMSKADGAKLDRISHRYTDESMTHDREYHWQICADCGAPTEKEKHQSNCVNPWVCAVCEVSSGDALVPFTEHTVIYLSDESFHWQHCTTCGQDLYDRESHYDYCDGDKSVCAACGEPASRVYIGDIRHKETKAAFDSISHFIQCVVCGETWNEQEHYTSCEMPDQCQGCAAKASDGAVIPVAHLGPFGDYAYDDVSHWRMCEACGEKADLGPHTDYCTNYGRSFHQCMVCTIINETEAEWNLIHVPIETRHDETYHWEQCQSCGEEVDRRKHDFNELGFCAYCGYQATAPQPAKPTYSLQGVKYDGKAVSGKLDIKGGALPGAGEMIVRVTFFLFNNYYMATVGEVEPDGSFAVEGVGPIEYITVLAFGGTKDGEERLAVAEILLD